MASSYSGPVPKPTPESKPYWEGTRQQKLMLQRCDDCGVAHFYPRGLCPSCFSRKLTWFESAGRGVVHTFTINYRPPKGFPPDTPIIIAMVQLDEGPRLMTNLVGIAADPKLIRCEMRVEVEFEAITDEITLPKFRPERAGADQ